MGAYWAILNKDLRTELRTRQTITSTLVFSVLVLVVFNFAFELRDVNLIALAPGVLWATFLFNGMLVLGRVFLLERENAAMDGLLLAPIDRGSIFAAKWSLSFLLMLFTEAAVLVVFGAFFDTNAFSPLVLLAAVLGTAGFSATGTALAVVAFNSRAREALLPILLLPLTVPIIIAAVRATSLSLASAPLQETAPWLNLIAAFDVVFGVVCYYSFGVLVEE